MSPIQFLKDSRREGIKTAWDKFRRRRHLLPIIAYIVLALAVAYTFGIERTHSENARNHLANEVHQVLVQGCNRGNELRFTLQEIIRNSAKINEPRIKEALKSGQITQDVADQAHKFTTDTLKELAPVNCSQAYPEPDSGGQ